jgi:hypothetical protein
VTPESSHQPSVSFSGGSEKSLKTIYIHDPIVNMVTGHYYRFDMPTSTFHFPFSSTFNFHVLRLFVSCHKICETKLGWMDEIHKNEFMGSVKRTLDLGQSILQAAKSLQGFLRICRLLTQQKHVWCKEENPIPRKHIIFIFLFLTSLLVCIYCKK